MAKTDRHKQQHPRSGILDKLPFFKKKQAKVDEEQLEKEKKNTGKRRFRKPSLPGRTLVFEYTGFELRAVVAKSSFLGDISFSRVAVSKAVAIGAAVGEVVQKLRESGKGRLPKTAVLITPSAASELLFLPVDPKNKKAARQINEMVRWELEELFVAQSDIWSLDALLQGRGLIDSAQRLEIKEQAGPGFSKTAAFEALASREEIDRCLEIQEQALGEEGDLLTSALSMADEEQFDQFTWWGGGINESVCGEWKRAFAQHKLKLTTIYPQLGAALPLVAQDLQNVLLVEIRQEQYALFQLWEGKLNTVALHSRPPGALDRAVLERNIRAVLHSEVDNVIISAPLIYRVHAKELAVALNRAVSLLFQSEQNPGFSDCPPESAAAIKGVAMHALKRARANTQLSINALAEKPPLWKNRELWPWAALVVLIATAVGGETYLQQKAESKEWELDKAEIEFSKRQEMIKLSQETSRQVGELNRVLKTKELELAELKHFRHILNNVIYYRQALAPGLLEVIRSSVNEYVLVDLLEESNDRQGFYLEGWTVNDTQGQLFINQLNTQLAQWKYKVEEVQLVKGKGPFDMDGFFLKIWLRKIPSAEGQFND